MQLFRSEEELPEPHGGTMSRTTLEARARDWYGDRLDPDWRPRTRDESQAIFERHGLTGDFWRLPG